MAFGHIREVAAVRHRFCVLTALFPLLPPTAQAAELSVDQAHPQGSDANPGTSLSAWPRALISLPMWSLRLWSSAHRRLASPSPWVPELRALSGGKAPRRSTRCSSTAVPALSRTVFLPNGGLGGAALVAASAVETLPTVLCLGVNRVCSLPTAFAPPVALP